VSVYGQNLFSTKDRPVRFNRFKDGKTALNDGPGKHKGRPKTSNIDDNCVIVECSEFLSGRI
jgi:hypothetical protein